MADRNALMGDDYYRLDGRDQALADLAWERSAENQLMDHAKGFLSGFTNPFGTMGYAAHAATRNLPQFAPIGQDYRDTMQRWEDNSPYANTAGSLAMGGRSVARLFGMSPRNANHLGGVLLSASPVVRNVQDVLFTRDHERRKLQQLAREYGAAGY